MSNSSNHPLVSVIIPAYNAAEFLHRTLLSILQQSYSNFEVWVIDDGSSDETPSIVKSLSQEDSRVNYIRQANAGVAAARNRGIQASRGEFIVPLDADDLWYPEAMEKMIATFQSQGEQLGVVYAWSVDIDEFDIPLKGFHAATVCGDVYKTLICHNFLGNASSSMIRRSCLKQVGVYNTQFRNQKAQGCEDWDIYLRLAERFSFQCLPEFLIGYRNTSKSMSVNFEQMARSQHLMLEAVQQQHPELPNFLYRLSKSSYYLFLAHQSHARKLTSQTLHWLKQAITVDPITPIGRLGFYILFFNSIGRLVKQRFLSQMKEATITVSFQSNAKTTDDSSLKPSPDISISKFQIWLKLLVSQLLHQSLSKI